MFDENTPNTDSDRNIHDEVLADIIERKEKVVRFLSSKLGIDSVTARDVKLAADILLQLLREENPWLDELGDAEVFISEWADEENDEKVQRGNKNVFYDRAKAKAYIDTYWKSYNPAYPSFKKGGGDCTNFISQVLYAGGMPWSDDGVPANHKKSTNWYCKPGATSKDSERRITFSWKIAAVFKAHWIKRAARHRIFSYTEAIQSINELSGSVFLGDVVQFCYSSGVPYHTLAVTGYNRDPEYNIRDVVLASHDIDSNTRSLYRTMLKYPSDYKLRVYNIKLGD